MGGCFIQWALVLNKMKILLPLMILLGISFGCKSKDEKLLNPISDIQDAFLTDLEEDAKSLTKLTDKDKEELIEYFKELKPYDQIHKQYPLHRARFLLINKSKDTIIVNGSPDSHTLMIAGKGTYMFDRKRTEQLFHQKLQGLLENKNNLTPTTE